MLKDGKEVILTREQTIQEHRKMWTWIAARYADGVFADVVELKRHWLSSRGFSYVISDCFLCQYAIEESARHMDDACNRCKYCPLVWYNKYDSSKCNTPCLDRGGQYLGVYLALGNGDRQMASRYATKIANLPEKSESLFSRIKKLIRKL